MFTKSLPLQNQAFAQMLSDCYKSWNLVASRLDVEDIELVLTQGKCDTSRHKRRLDRYHICRAIHRTFLFKLSPS